MGKILQRIRSHSLKEMLQEYAWLSRYSMHYKKEVLWYILVGILGTAVSLAGSILSKHIIDAVTGFNVNGIVVALDTNLTPELIEEGFMREIVSKIQTMRKDADFEVTDHIRVTVAGSEKISAIVENNRAEIAAATLADSFGDAAGDVQKDWNINGENVTITVERIR